MVLPMEGVDASDEALYASTDFLESKQESVDILVEELLTVWREINKDANYVTAQRKTRWETYCQAARPWRGASISGKRAML